MRMRFNTIQYLLLFFICIATFLVASCNDKTINIDGVTSVNIPFCLLNNTNEAGIVINDSAAYYQFFANEGCSEHIIGQLPAINFNEKTLLGKKSTTMACFPFYRRNVYAITNDQLYVYEIKVTGGNVVCDSILVNYNWISIPKLPANYEVDFVLNYE